MSHNSIYPREGKLNVKTQAQIHNEWNYANTRRFVVAFHKHKEKDMLKWIESHKPFQTTFKRLVREEKEREAMRAKERALKAR